MTLMNLGIVFLILTLILVVFGMAGADLAWKIGLVLIVVSLIIWAVSKFSGGGGAGSNMP